MLRKSLGFVIASIVIALIALWLVDRYGYLKSDHAEPYLDLLIAIGILGFLFMLIYQISRESIEHKIEFRPMIVLDGNDGEYFKHIQIRDRRITTRRITIKLVNLGKIPTDPFRIFALPFGKNTAFQEDKQRLLRYIQKVGSEPFKSSRHGVILEPMQDKELHSSSKRYLIIGPDMKRLKESEKKLDRVFDEFKNSDELVRIRDRMNRILQEFDPDERECLYETNSRDGDLVKDIMRNHPHNTTSASWH